jgi:hypothetical protein
MSRLTRILLVTIMIVALSAGASLAGPGKNASGDPDIPAITNPGGSKTPSLVDESTRVAIRSSRIDEETRTVSDPPNDWRIALRLYLRWLRVVPR